MRDLSVIRTRVGIVGGGPAGLMLSHLFSKSGIDTVVVETRDHETIRTTHRAGILEHGSVDILADSDVSDRVLKAGYKHEGVDLRFGGSHRIDSRIWSGRRCGCIRKTTSLSTWPLPANVTTGDVRFSVSDTEVLDLTSDIPKDPSKYPAPERRRLAVEWLGPSPSLLMTTE